MTAIVNGPGVRCTVLYWWLLFFCHVCDRCVQQLGGSSQGKHSPGCIEFGKYEINSWYSSPFPRDL